VNDALSSSLRAATCHAVLFAFGPLLRTTNAVDLLPDADVCKYPPPITLFEDGQTASSVTMLSLFEIVAGFDATF
jgi:hypothetical protein